MKPYLYRAAPLKQFGVYQPESHGYPCDYIGGDEGPSLMAGEYLLVRDRGECAVILHALTGVYYVAVRIGEPTFSPVGDDWRQWQADFMLSTDAFECETEHLTAQLGPFTFYDLLVLLEGGDVSPREAIAAGYFGEAVFSLRGHLHALPCSSPEEALALLDLLVCTQNA